MGNRFEITMSKKTGKQDVESFIEIGWVEAEKMTVKYPSVILFAFCQDLCANLIIVPN